MCWSDRPGHGELDGLCGWAAVGPVPAGIPLPAAARLQTGGVPLAELPPWVGVDRALVGWRAWQRSRGPVLVADAGTALSLTRIAADGAFAGGRLLAGVALQLAGLQSGTAGLPALQPPVQLPPERWPRHTDQAMVAGVLAGLAAAIAEAVREAWDEDPGCRVWITGGDGAQLAPQVQQLLGGGAVGLLAGAQLALEALAELRPAPGR